MAAPLLLHIEGPIATITFNRPERRSVAATEHREGETLWNSVYACRIMASR
jgi:hypothetical protein